MEDETIPADLNSLVPTKLAGIGNAMTALKESAAGATDKSLWSLLDKLEAAVTQVVTLRDTAQMNVLLLEAKIETAVNLVGGDRPHRGLHEGPRGTTSFSTP